MSLSAHREKQVLLDPVAAPWAGDLLGLWNPMLGGMQTWNGAFSKAAAVVGREWLDFINRRIKEDMALPQRLASSRGLDEAWQIYAEFWQKAVQDYQHELAELARLNGEVMAERAISPHLGKPQGEAQHAARPTRN